jgi:signal recognition particle GTPase
MSFLKDSWNHSLSRFNSKKANDFFQNQVKFMLERKSFCINDYLDSLKDSKKFLGFDSPIRRLLPWVQNNPMATELRRDEELLQKLSNEEKLNPKLISAETRNRIGRETGKSIEEVNSVMKKFYAAKDLHDWLHRRYESGKSIPRTVEEAKQIASSADSGIRKSILRFR